MKKLIIVSIVSFFALLGGNAQRVRFNVSISPDTLVEQMKLYVQPLNIEGEGKTTTLRLKENRFTGSVPQSSSGFYQLVAVCGNMQMITPVYFGDTTEVAFRAAVDDRSLMLSGDADNKALSGLNRLFAGMDRMLWTRQGMSGEEIEKTLSFYTVAAGFLPLFCDVSPAVADYMKVWAYIRACGAYDFIPRAQGVEHDALPFAKSDILSPAVENLDNDVAALFMPAVQIVIGELPAKASLPEKLDSLYSSYENKHLCAKVAAILVERFLSQHDYVADFDGGLALLQDVTRRYNLSGVYVDEYLKRKSTIKGAPFPAGVVLEDVNGNVVDFSKFKGKYVYIDMWASWCGPCCREVPHLQALETSLKNDDVVFVSISCDADTNAWKEKMAELGMHGNQLHDKNNSLGTALNVTGIPFFVIYDKEGRLHTYRAMRPSSGDLLKGFLEKLH